MSAGAPSGWCWSCRAAVLAIQVKMTGQVFVLPAGHDARPHVHLAFDAGRRALVAVPRHAQVRAGGAIPPRRGRHGPGRGRRGECSTSSGRSRSTPPSRCAPSGSHPRAAGRGSSRCSSTRRSWPASATSMPTRRCGARSCTRCAARRACGPPTSGACTRPSAAVLSRGHGAARLVRRRLHRARGRRRDAGPPRGLPAHRAALPPLRSAHQRLVLGSRATHFCSWCQRLPGKERSGTNAPAGRLGDAFGPPRPRAGASCPPARAPSARQAGPSGKRRPPVSVSGRQASRGTRRARHVDHVAQDRRSASPETRSARAARARS